MPDVACAGLVRYLPTPWVCLGNQWCACSLTAALAYWDGFGPSVATDDLRACVPVTTAVVQRLGCALGARAAHPLGTSQTTFWNCTWGCIRRSQVVALSRRGRVTLAAVRLLHGYMDRTTAAARLAETAAMLNMPFVGGVFSQNLVVASFSREGTITMVVCTLMCVLHKAPSTSTICRC